MKNSSGLSFVFLVLFYLLAWLTVAKGAPYCKIDEKERILEESLDEGLLPLMSEEDIDADSRNSGIDHKFGLDNPSQDEQNFSNNVDFDDVIFANVFFDDVLFDDVDFDAGTDDLNFKHVMEELLYYDTDDGVSISGRKISIIFVDLDQALDELDQLIEVQYVSDLFVVCDQPIVDEEGVVPLDVVAKEMVEEKAFNGDDGDQVVSDEVILAEVYVAMFLPYGVLAPSDADLTPDEVYVAVIVEDILEDDEELQILKKRPESLNPFLPADQAEFTFDEITFSSNNEVAILYPSHIKSEYFEIVSDFVSKYCLKEAFTGALNQYFKYLDEFWYIAKTQEDSKIWVFTPTGGIRGEIGVNTIKNAIRDNYSNEYVASPSLTIVRPWFSSIGYNREIGAKETLKKSYLPPSKWGENVPMESQAPKTSLKTKKNVLQGKNPRARSGLRRKKSSKHTFESNNEASKSKTSQSDKETQSSSAKDKSPSHPSAFTLVVAEMHKEAHQAVGGLTSLGATNEEGAHPQLSSGCDASADSTAKVDPEKFAPNDSIP
ncbi:hypothetical protein Tco_0519847 [Tanacetum coccineum]